MKHIEKILIGIISVLFVLIVIIATDFWLLWLPLAHSPEYPQKVAALFMALTALVTLLVVYATFHATKQSNLREETRRNEELRKENRDRKERLLNEIIEWAIDISKGSFDRDMDSLITTVESARQNAVVNQDEYKRYSAQIIGKNNYIVKVASDIDSDLTDSVKRLNELLRKRFEMTIPYFQQRNATVFSPLKNKLQIYELTNDIIEKAAKLL